MDLSTGNIIESKQIPTMVVDSLQEWFTMVQVMPCVYLDDLKMEFEHASDDEGLVCVTAERDGARCIIRVMVDDKLEARVGLDLLSGSIATSNGPNRMLAALMPDVFQAVCLAKWAWGEWA